MKRAAALLAVVALSACAAPHVQSPLTPPAGFAGPRIEDAIRPGAPGAFVVQDGARLPFRLWSPAGGEPWAVIIALHGMNDHGAAFRLAGPWWAERGVATYGFDQRGFGRAPEPGVWAGEALLTEDLRTVTALVRARHPGAVLAIVGESMGGAVATAAFASDRPPDADRLVLLAPAVWGWSSQNLLNRSSLWVAARLWGDRAIEPPDFLVRRIVASDNLMELIRNSRDPDFLLATRFDAVSGLVDLMESASRGLGRVRAPTLLMYGAHDQIVPKAAVRRALDRAGASETLRTAWHTDGWHLLNRDLQAEAVYGDVEAFLRDPSAPPPSGAPPVGPQLRSGAESRSVFAP